LSATSAIKDLVRPPFANYDIVVYFGCGLFALPLAYHYFIEPSDFRFPRFTFNIGMGFADEAISVLSLLFAVYLLGHIIAYSGSLIIEKSIDAFFGKVSSAILLSSYAPSEDKRELISAWQFGRWKSAFQSGRGPQNILRVLVHLPAIPLYFIVTLIGGFDYYRGRVPRHVLFLAKQKLHTDGHGPVTLYDPWYKTLEHDVINNHPGATGRMYNYLVISGLFRSLSMLFLACLWAELYYCAHSLLDGHYLLKPLMSDEQSRFAHLFSFLLLYIAYGFSISSYMKFQRRYAEEAIFAYVLAR
jgi:hypothetical protein